MKPNFSSCNKTNNLIRNNKPNSKHNNPKIKHNNKPKTKHNYKSNYKPNNKHNYIINLNKFRCNNNNICSMALILQLRRYLSKI